MHSKFFLFSQSGETQWVVISTSANATVQAATAPWNDAFTLVGDQEIYDTFATVFDEMFADQPVAQPDLQAGSGATTMAFHPLRGPASSGTRSCARSRRCSAGALRTPGTDAPKCGSR
ncbi:MAG: hypothetical protein LH468_03400 [Nocardioides sp.]|nr:hypothetical protein [Nocardioides sp.]